MLANAKRTESKVESSFKVPKERVASVAAYLDEGEEMPASTGTGEVDNDMPSSLRSYSNRRYRELASSGASNSGNILSCTVIITEQLGNKNHITKTKPFSIFYLAFVCS